MKQSEWGMMGVALMLTLLDRLEKKGVLSGEEGRNVVLEAGKLTETLVKQPLIPLKGHAIKWLVSLYDEAKMNAEK